jgi:hypothetical protein
MTNPCTCKAEHWQPHADSCPAKQFNPQCIHIPDGSVVISGEVFDHFCGFARQQKACDEAIDQLRGNLSLAEEGLASYAQENQQLRDDNAICRSAIEDAVLLVENWEADDAHDSDLDQGAARATRRMLSEAIGKATPRLLMERPEGQKLYGLRWREMRAEVERLQAQVASLQREAHTWSSTLGKVLKEHAHEPSERCPLYKDGQHRRKVRGKCDCELTDAEAHAIVAEASDALKSSDV